MKNHELKLGDVVLWQPHPSFPTEICMVVGGVESGTVIVSKETQMSSTSFERKSIGEYVEVLFTSDGLREWVPINSLKFIIGSKAENKK